MGILRTEQALKELIGFMTRHSRVLTLGLIGALIIGSWAPTQANITCGKPSKCTNPDVVAQVRAAVAAVCPCDAATVREYAKCWNAVVKERVKTLGKVGFPGPCRTDVKRALANSTCGRADGVLCRKFTRKGAEICRVAKASKCDDPYGGVASSCADACACGAAKASKRSIGCDFFATSMDVIEHGNCFAAYVVNASSAPAHIAVSFQNQDRPVESFTRVIGGGPGSAMTLSPYNAQAGVPPGAAAVAFLGGGTGAAPLCPVASAVPVSSFAGTGLGSSFQITTDVPVAAYQINPFGGGSAAFPGASLLLPTGVWGTSYIAVNAFPQGAAGGKPSLNIVASENETIVTIVPVANVVGGSCIPPGTTGQPLSISLAKGQNAQITQTAELTGSVVTANKPIGLMAGNPCMNVPTANQFCDHGEQMIPPVPAIGHQYAAVMYRPRAAGETQTFWRLVGVANGTQLSYSTAVGGPPTLAKGEVAQFLTGTPFTVASQDADHPFMLFAYMTGGATLQQSDQRSDLGDPDFVLVVPPDQYVSQYVFFTDPTYPETDLVVVRKRDTGGVLHDVTLDCAGVLTGWQEVGTDFEFTRADLTTGNFQNVGNCSTGVRQMTSEVPFGLWVWGWGSAGTTPQTRNVSYAYPGGMKVQSINGVVF